MRYLLIALTILTYIKASSQSEYNRFSTQDKEVVFLDNFDNNVNRWWTGDNRDALGVISNGNYILEWRGSSPIWYSLNGIVFDFTQDFEIEANIKQTSGKIGNLFGLIFNKSDKGECGFIVNCNSESVVYQDRINEERRFIKDGGEFVSNISVVYNDFTKFTIQKIKNQVTFYVNEVFLKEGYISDFSSRSTGFQIWYNSRICIDYLKVSYLHERVVSPIIVADNSKNDIKKQPSVKSDVDENIPVCSTPNPDRFALIIGNEDYSSKQKEINTEMNVEFARTDAAIFKEHAIKVLGIPEQNITFLLDATLGEMGRGIDKMNKIIKVTDGAAEVFVYYAGHGLPNETTKEAYLIPVDVNGSNLNYAISLNTLYAKLTEFPSKRVTVFLDACFSGGARNQGLLQARGVKVRPKEDNLKGKLVVFTASSGEQSSLPYKDKNHGLFTYFLLKKLQESRGDISYKELSDYLSKSVKLNSIIVNDKEQYPQTNTSPDIQSEWMNWRLK